MASPSAQDGHQPGNSRFLLDGPTSQLDRLMRWLAKEHGDKLMLSYPNTQGDYNVKLTGSDLERLTAFIASRYSDAFKRNSKGEISGSIGFGGIETKIVAMVGISTLSSYLTFVALQRIGLSPMMISPRLADEAYAHLLRVVGCSVVIAGSGSIDTIRRIKTTFEDELDLIPLLSDDEVVAGLGQPYIDLPDPDCKPGFIIQWVISPLDCSMSHR